MARISKQLLFIGIALTSLFFVTTGKADITNDTAAVSFGETTGNAYNVPNLTRGWTFDVINPIAVTALGVFDDGEDGLQTAHIVALWNSSGTALATTFVTPGTTATLVDQFRYNSITTLFLSPGQYTIGAYYPNVTAGTTGDYEVFGDIPDLSVDPDISIVNFRFAHPGYFDPAPYLTDQQNFGANFLTTAVPEPSSLVLMGLGASAWIFRRRK